MYVPVFMRVSMYLCTLASPRGEFLKISDSLMFLVIYPENSMYPAKFYVCVSMYVCVCVSMYMCVCVSMYV